MDFRGILQLALVEQLENAVERNTENIRRRTLRDASNPFKLIESNFIRNFRLNKEAVRYLVIILGPHLQHGQRNNALSVEIKILSTLAFFATGSYQRSVGENVHLVIEQSRLSRIIAEVTDAMVENLLETHVKFPQTEMERNTVKEIFYEKYNFPGIIGALDCTHIAIIAPHADDAVRPGVAYYNRKGFYSINVQMICDANMIILNCNPRFPGSTHYSAIFALSSVKSHLQELYETNELNSSWLIGDSGYPLQPWLLTPIEDANANSPEGRYTRQHILSRNVIERCFGVLKQRFRCLLRQRTLHYSPVRVAKIVLSCVILHNIALSYGVELLQDDGTEIEEVANVQLVQEHGNYLQEGRRIRNEVIRRHFTD